MRRAEVRIVQGRSRAIGSSRECNNVNASITNTGERPLDDSHKASHAETKPADFQDYLWVDENARCRRTSRDEAMCIAGERSIIRIRASS